MGWLVDLEAADFVGKDALIQQQRSGRRFTLASFEICDRRKLPDGTALYILVDGGEQPVGSINCSAWSETLGSMIGNASLQSEHAGIESAWTELDGKPVPVKLSNPPLLKFERARQIPAPIELLPIENPQRQ